MRHYHHKDLVLTVKYIRYHLSNPGRLPVFNNIYLDINSSWTNDEFEIIYNLVKDKNVYVYTNGMVRISAGNKDKLFEQLNRLQFSLFPLYEIKDAATSLFISNSTAVSPDFEDLKESAFLSSTKDYLNSSPRIKFF